MSNSQIQQIMVETIRLFCEFYVKLRLKYLITWSLISILKTTTTNTPI
jgi:hypothetical protein